MLRYLTFSRSSSIHLISNTREVFIEGRGWVLMTEIKIGDRSNLWGEVVFIGSEDQVRQFNEERL